MPTYEHVIAGQVVERSTTIADHPSGFDEQMAALAAQPDSGWHRVDAPVAAPQPIEAEPSTLDTVAVGCGAGPEQITLPPGDVVPLAEFTEES